MERPTRLSVVDMRFISFALITWFAIINLAYDIRVRFYMKYIE